jgi:hypothetical protein
LEFDSKWGKAGQLKPSSTIEFRRDPAFCDFANIIRNLSVMGKYLRIFADILSSLGIADKKHDEHRNSLISL